MSNAESRIKELEERRAARRTAHEAARLEQQADDLEALDRLEEEHGYDRTVRIDLTAWKPGAATMVVARVPARGEAYFKRYEQRVAKAKSGTTEALDAAAQLAEACLIYPSRKDAPELYESTMDIAPGVLTHIALQLVKAAQGAAEEEKKG